MSQPTRVSLLEELKETLSSDRWTEFCTEYGLLIRRWLIGQNVSPNDADDIQQETLMAVLKDLPNFEHNGRIGAFRNWLRTILANRLRRLWDKRKRDAAHGDLQLLAESLEDPSSQLSNSWDKEHHEYFLTTLLQKARTRFDEQTIDLFIRIVLREEPAKQVADELGITLGNARVRQHRVLRSLQEMGAGLLD